MNLNLTVVARLNWRSGRGKGDRLRGERVRNPHPKEPVNDEDGNEASPLDNTTKTLESEESSPGLSRGKKNP